MISYQQKMQQIEQNTFKPKLSNQQLEQIRQMGTFQVKSNLQNIRIPYIWKINDWVLRGRVNITHVWQCGLAGIYSRFIELSDMVITQLPRSIRNISKIPVQLFQLIFGKKAFDCFYTPDYHREVIKDFWSDVLDKQFKDGSIEIAHQFLQLLDLQYQEAIYQNIVRAGKSSREIRELEEERQKKIDEYNEKKKKIYEFENYLRGLENGFEIMWKKIRKRVLIKISNQISEDVGQKTMIEVSEEQPLITKQQTKKNQEIITKLGQQKLTMYKTYLKQQLQKQQKLTLPIIEQLLTLLTIITIISSKIKQHNNKLSTIKSSISQHINKKYTIRSKYHKFHEQNVAQLYHIEKIKRQQEFYDGLLKDKNIQGHINQQYQLLYQKYQTLKTTFPTHLTQKHQLTQPLYLPSRVFKSTYLLRPPYQVLNSRGYYSLKKQQQLSIDTSTNFWKFKLYAMRIKTWTINCAIYLWWFAWNGIFGLRCLFGVGKFVIDQDINGKTGQKINVERATFLKVFSTVLVGVKKSRNHFEILPDRGLFGKKFSRVFNYIECYVFRLVFVGVIIDLICYPIAIIIISFISIILVISVWIWVPMVLIVNYLFNILIFQFERSTTRRGIVIGGIPLLMIVFNIIKQIIVCFAVVVWFVIGNCFSVLHFLFLVGQRYWRLCTDSIMLIIIRSLGRTPSRDTAIAKKISGLGVTRSYFFSVLEEDVYVLIQCALEKIIMKKFIEMTTNQICYNKQKYQKIIKYVLKPLTNNRYFSPQRNIIDQNTQNLLQTFNNSINHYMSRYPNYPHKIRFTSQQLSKYFPNSLKLVKNFVEKTNIKQWIFDQRQISYEDYNQLTRNIWIEIFNCGEEIFQPIESIQCRVKLVDGRNNNEKMVIHESVTAILSALQGEIQLTTTEFQFCPGQKSLLDHDEPIRSINLLCNIYEAHSGVSISLDLQNPNEILVLPRNLSQLKRYDEWQYARMMDKYKKSIGGEGLGDYY